MKDLNVDIRLMVCGLICLTSIEIALILCSGATEVVTAGIVGIIAMAIGVVIPTPKIDNKRGVLKW